MRGGDGGDDGDMRADHARQRGEFARMVHPHFEDAVVDGGGHTREAQRHADMIVITLDRAMRPDRTKAVERAAQRLPRPRLYRRSGDATDQNMAARPRPDTAPIHPRGATDKTDWPEPEQTLPPDAT